MTSPAPSALPGQGLPGDGEGIEGEREEAPHRHRHLVGGHRHVAQPGGHPGGDDEHGPQGDRADQQRQAVRRRPQHPPGVRSQARVQRAGPAGDHGDERGRHAGLGEDGAECGTGDAEAQAVDQDEVQRDVGAEADDRGQQRRPGVLQAAQDTGDREDHEHGRDARGGDAQVGHRLGQGVRRGAEQPADRRGEHRDQRGGGDAQREGQPEAVDPGPDRRAFGAGAELAGDDAGGAVGEEHEQVGRGDERGAGHAEAGQRGQAQVPDDRRVGQQEERLGDQGEEGGHREAQDVALLADRCAHPCSVGTAGIVSAPAVTVEIRGPSSRRWGAVTRGA